MGKKHRPGDFSDILNSPARPLIVGGQAVNIWAEFYATSNPTVASQEPFVSKDADIFGDRALAARLARTPGWRITYFNEPRTIAVAVLTKDLPDHSTLTVEILRSVKGLTTKELQDSDVVELRPGEQYRIPSPIRLLKAKLTNLQEIKPIRDQDIQHSRLLVNLAHAYLTDQLKQVRAHRITERHWINAFHELHRITSLPMARQLDRRFAFNLSQSLPTLREDPTLPKITALYKNLPSANRPGATK